MTASLNARTPSATVHALSGSTPPGAGPPVQPFGVAAAPVAEMPDTFTSLGDAAAGVAAGLAGRRPASDEWRRRLVPLIRREDAISRAVNNLPPDIFNSVRSKSKRELWSRMARRISRWTERLIAEPSIDARSAALKADVYIELVAAGWTGSTPSIEERLALEVARDTLNVGIALNNSDPGAMMVDSLGNRHPDPFARHHAEIMGLQAIIEATPEGDARHEAAWHRWGAIDRQAMASSPTTFAGAIGALEYARRELFQFEIEGIEEKEQGTAEPCMIVLNLLDKAIAVLRRNGASLAPIVDRSISSRADARLITLADAVEAAEAACNAHTAAHSGRETAEGDDAFDGLAGAFGPIEEEIAATPADTLTGILAKARAAQVPTVRAFDCPFALSLTDDVWRLFGRSMTRSAMPAPQATASAA